MSGPTLREVLMAAVCDAYEAGRSFGYLYDASDEYANAPDTEKQRASIVECYASQLQAAKVLETERLTFDPANRGPGNVAVVYDDGRHVPVRLTLGSDGVECAGYASQLQPEPVNQQMQSVLEAIATAEIFDPMASAVAMQTMARGILNAIAAEAAQLVDAEESWESGEIDRVVKRLESSDPDFDDCNDAVVLLRKYKNLCREIGRGDSYHLGRIDSAIHDLETQKPASAQPVDDNWIEWCGGRKSPVPSTAKIKVRLRSGIEELTTGATGGWTHGSAVPHLEIVAYCYVQDIAQQPASAQPEPVNQQMLAAHPPAVAAPDEQQRANWQLLVSMYDKGTPVQQKGAAGMAIETLRAMLSSAQQKEDKHES